MTELGVCLCACTYCYLIQIAMPQIHLSLTTFYYIMSFRGSPLGQMYCSKRICFSFGHVLSLKFETGILDPRLPLFVVNISPSMKANEKNRTLPTDVLCVLCGSIYKDNVWCLLEKLSRYSKWDKLYCTSTDG